MSLILLKMLIVVIWLIFTGGLCLAINQLARSRTELALSEKKYFFLQSSLGFTLVAETSWAGILWFFLSLSH